jgi:hypothetical protein
MINIANLKNEREKVSKRKQEEMKKKANKWKLTSISEKNYYPIKTRTKEEKMKKTIPTSILKEHHLKSKKKKGKKTKKKKLKMK